MTEKKKKNKQVNKEQQGNEIPKPKEDVRIEKNNPKFNSVLSHLVKKPNPKKDNESPE